MTKRSLAVIIVLTAAFSSLLIVEPTRGLLWIDIHKLNIMDPKAIFTQKLNELFKKIGKMLGQVGHLYDSEIKLVDTNTGQMHLVYVSEKTMGLYEELLDCISSQDDLTQEKFDVFLINFSNDVYKDGFYGGGGDRAKKIVDFLSRGGHLYDSEIKLVDTNTGQMHLVYVSEKTMGLYEELLDCLPSQGDLTQEKLDVLLLNFSNDVYKDGYYGGDSKKF